jgi:hypothetical protein
MGLAGAEEPDVDSPTRERRERARKIDKRYTEGELVKVAGGRHQADAELIQNLLLDGGVPSMLRRSGGFDVPDFLAAGPRDVMVPQSGVAAARDILGDMAAGDTSAAKPNPAKLFLGLVVALAIGGAIVAIIDQLT